MNISDKVLTMTYKEFEKYCSDRACDGQWCLDEALTCISIIKTVNSVRCKKFKFFTDKKATEIKQEKLWQNIIQGYIKHKEGEKNKCQDCLKKK